MTSSGSNKVVFILLPLLLVLILFSISFGAADISISTALKAILQYFGLKDFGLKKSIITIIFTIRLPRILLAVITGTGLAISGAVFQAVFQNPLAEPYLLGISSGASLGATIAIVFGAGMILSSLWSITIFAFAGSIMSIVFILLITKGGRSGFNALLLCGIAVGYIFQAVVSFLMMLNRDKTEQIVFWTMGSLGSATWTKVVISGSIILFCILIIFINSEKLNIMSLGIEEAHSLGINPRSCGIFFMILGCLITAAAVSVSGIIGFVGLITPHIMRFFTGADNRKVLPSSAATGACLMVVADIIARSVLAPMEIPIGVVTAFIGGPFLLVMIRTRGRRSV
ncbi:MAG: iron ABC transporter permease [Spirochaetales bacterium]|nr:iron ABC transporter permease [Spirochaetales bacterium]